MLIKPKFTTMLPLLLSIVLFKDLMELYLHMGRLLQEKLTQWKDKSHIVSHKNQVLFQEWLYKFSIRFQNVQGIYNLG